MTPEKLNEVISRRDRVRAAFVNYVDGSGHDAKLIAEDVSGLIDDSVKLAALERAGYGVEEIKRLDAKIETLAGRLVRVEAVFDLARRWCNRPESVLREGATVLRNDADIWIELRKRVDAVILVDRPAAAQLKEDACAIPGCLHHTHPDCPCGHAADVIGPCGGCNCCDPAP